MNHKYNNANAWLVFNSLPVHGSILEQYKYNFYIKNQKIAPTDGGQKIHANKFLTSTHMCTHEQTFIQEVLCPVCKIKI